MERANLIVAVLALAKKAIVFNLGSAAPSILTYIDPTLAHSFLMLRRHHYLIGCRAALAPLIHICSQTGSPPGSVLYYSSTIFSVLAHICT